MCSAPVVVIGVRAPLAAGQVDEGDLADRVASLLPAPLQRKLRSITTCPCMESRAPCVAQAATGLLASLLLEGVNVSRNLQDSVPGVLPGHTHGILILGAATHAPESGETPLLRCVLRLASSAAVLTSCSAAASACGTELCCWWRLPTCMMEWERDESSLTPVLPVLRALLACPTSSCTVSAHVTSTCSQQPNLAAMAEAATSSCV